MGLRLVSVIIAGLVSAAFAVPTQAAEPAKAAAKATPSASAKRGDPSSAECGWIGKRIIQLLSRDDVVAAGEFRQFYVGFGCSEPHLGAAFGCAIEGATPGAADACAARSECIDLCWTSPTASTLDKAPRIATPQPPAAAKPQGNAAPAKAPAAPPQPPKKPAEKSTEQVLTLPHGPYDAKP